jgi:hypothetical protein
MPYRIALGVLLVVGVAWIPARSPNEPSWYLLFPPLIASLVYGWQFYFYVRDYSVRLSDAGVRDTVLSLKGLHERFTPWSEVKSMRRVPGGFVLRRTDGGEITLDPRTFRSPDDVIVFIEAKLGRGAR